MSKSTRRSGGVEDDERYYLREGFDPNSLTITQIRNILVIHDIDHPPSGTKKLGWVEHFKTHVLPRATEFLNEYDNILPHGMGIVDAAPPRRTARSKSPVKSTSSPSKARTTRTRSMSPAKELSAPVDVKPPPSPSRRSRRTGHSDSTSEPVGNILESAVSLAPPGTAVTSVVQEKVVHFEPLIETGIPTTSSSPKKNRKTLKQQPYINPNDYELTSKSENKLAPVSITGTSPKKSIKDEKEKVSSSSDSSPFSDQNVFQKPPPQSQTESPFSNKNIFQKGSPSSPSSHKRSIKEIGETPKSPSSKKRAVDITPSKVTNTAANSSPISVPFFTPEIPDKYQHPISDLVNSSNDIPLTPGSGQVRHFTSFPNTPEDSNPENIPVTKVPPATAPHTSVRNHSFPRASTFNKRLSFMPDVNELRVSNEFSRRLEEEKNQQPQIIFTPPSEPAFELKMTDNEEVEVDTPIDESPESVNSESITLDESDTKKLRELERELDEEEEELRKQSDKKLKLNFSIPYIFKTIVQASLILSLFFYSCWWTLERQRIGYCDVGFSSGPQTITIDPSLLDKVSPYVSLNTIYTVEDSINQAIKYVTPACVPCPDHATCYPDFKAICDDNYVPINSLISLGGILPFPPTCVPDMAKRNKVAALAKRAIEIINKLKAEQYCNSAPDTVAEISEEELRVQLIKQTLPSLSEEEFNELWRLALKDVEDEDDIIVRQD